MLPEAAEKVKNGACQPLSSEEYLKVRMNWANSEQGNLKGVDCQICKNRGTMTEIRNGYLVSVECSCMAKRRSLRRIERSGLRDLLDRCTLESFRTDEPWQSEMKRIAIDYLDGVGSNWFAAMGAVGAGKTHLCTAICREMLNAGKEVRYMLWCDEAVKLNALVGDVEAYEREIQQWKNAPVLYIDDLFKTKSSSAVGPGDVKRAFEIINFRDIGKGLVTIISSEKTIEEIMEIDEALGSRIFKRCRGHYLKLSGDKNRRISGT